MAANPFRCGPPVAGAHLAGRQGERQILCGIIERGRSTILLTGSRGFGKTSLAVAVTDQLSARGHHVVYVDTLRPVWGGTIAEQMEGTAGTPPALLVLDEVQSLVGSSRDLDTELVDLRRRLPDLSILMVGITGPAVCGRLADLATRPPGRYLQLRVGVIPSSTMVRFLRGRAKVGGKPMGTAAAELVVELGHAVPQHVQRLAHASFERAKAEITQKAVEDAVRDVASQHAPHYADCLRSLAPGHRRVLQVLRGGPLVHPRSAAFVEATGYANPAAARKSLQTLECLGLVAQDGHTFWIADPFLACWLDSGTARIGRSVSGKRLERERIPL